MIQKCSSSVRCSTAAGTHQLATVRETDDKAGPPLDAKVRYLLDPKIYSDSLDKVTAIETHMSWVFLAGDKAYKLKKPIQLAYLDFSTLEKREAACRAELALNRRLAPEVYVSVVPICATSTGFHLGGDGRIVDWLVVMNRVEESLMLGATLSRHCVNEDKLRALGSVLTRFYNYARPTFVNPTKYLARWRRHVRENRTALLNRDLHMPVAQVLKIDRVQRRFLNECGHILIRRLREHRIVDGHGDLRPEHIWLGEPIAVIDCLEFNPEFRVVDPFDELSYLAIECERLVGARLAGRIMRKLMWTVPHPPPKELLTFYRCYRAVLRANLSIAHLLEPIPRTPEKWRPLALAYLEIATHEAIHLERALQHLRKPKREKFPQPLHIDHMYPQSYE